MSRLSGAPRLTSPTPTVVFDDFWTFAAERLAMYYRRLAGSTPPWTTDPVLAAYRFTNTYRATDRVTQYLIREIQYRPDRSQRPDELFFRTMMFKLFNKIETWEMLERTHGPISWRSIDLDAIDYTLSMQLARRRRIYSAAYIVPAPALGAERKHTNHLKLIAMMMADRLPSLLLRAPSLASVYRALLNYPGLGHFLSFQFSIDLNYSRLLDFCEGDFVVAGPGAIDGIHKCFHLTSHLSPEDIIHHVTDRQTDEFADRGIRFPGLFGRPLQPIDCQNLFCEISKYARVRRPKITGSNKRTKIKQRFRMRRQTIPQPVFPPRWGIRLFDPLGFTKQLEESDQQLMLL